MQTHTVFPKQQQEEEEQEWWAVYVSVNGWEVEVEEATGGHVSEGVMPLARGPFQKPNFQHGGSSSNQCLSEFMQIILDAVVVVISNVCSFSGNWIRRQKDYDGLCFCPG